MEPMAKLIPVTLPICGCAFAPAPVANLNDSAAAGRAGFDSRKLFVRALPPPPAPPYILESRHRGDSCSGPFKRRFGTSGGATGE
jgi:hypothetical protein